jgi:hypothetical protein
MNRSPDMLRTVDFLAMGKRDATTFSRKVVAAGGIIPIYIHPYYPDGLKEYQGSRLTEYQTRRDTEIAAHLKNRAPIIIFEEKYFTDPPMHPPLPTCIKDATQGTLYVVQGDPEPINASWEDVDSVLRNAKVNEIQLGGAFSESCVWRARTHFLKQGFGITYPLATFSSGLINPLA